MNKGEELNPISILYGLLKTNSEPFYNHARIVIKANNPQRKKPKQLITTETSDESISSQIHAIMAHPRFHDYKLTNRDVSVIALLWKRYIDCIGAVSSWNALCVEVGMDIYKTNECLEFISDLLDRNIIAFNEITRSDYHMNPMVLLAGEFILSNELIMKILGKNIPNDIRRIITTPWKQNSDFIYDLKQCFRLIFNCFGELGTNRNRTQTLNPTALLACLVPIFDKLKERSNHLAIKRIIDEYQLDSIEATILLLVLYFQLTQDDLLTENELLHFICKTPNDYKEYSKYLHSDARLIRHNLIVIEEINTFVNRKDISIPDELKNKICEDVDVRMTDLVGYLKQNKALHLNKTDQKIKDLILPAKDIELLESLTKRFKLNHDNKLTVSNKGFIVLFYGSPGTGKTYAAGAIANALNKDLVALDCSALRNCYYSESEKSVKQVFWLMQKISVEVTNPPVFLINEADQLIHFRTDRANFSSRTDNSIQSIILEELERFTGIMILTTNLENNIDEAYYRRFNLKLKFSSPDEDCRYRLWKLHLKRYPVSNDINVSTLAKNYHFTGGQIALVLKNAYNEILTRKTGQQLITHSDIIRYAELERPWADGSQRKSVGF